MSKSARGAVVLLLLAAVGVVVAVMAYRGGRSSETAGGRVFVVRLAADGTASVAGRALPILQRDAPAETGVEDEPATLFALLRERAAAVAESWNPPVSRLAVRVHADPQAPWRAVQEVLACCARAHVQDIRLEEPTGPIVPGPLPLRLEQPSDRTDRLVITLRAGGPNGIQIAADDFPCSSFNDLAEKLKSFANVDETQPVVIDAQPEVACRDVAYALDACRRAGQENFSVSPPPTPDAGGAEK